MFFYCIVIVFASQLEEPVLFRFVLLFALFERDGLFTFGWGPAWRLCPTSMGKL